MSSTNKVFYITRRMETKSREFGIGEIAVDEFRSLQNTHTRRTPQHIVSSRGRPIINEDVLGNKAEVIEFRHTTMHGRKLIKTFL